MKFVNLLVTLLIFSQTTFVRPIGWMAVWGVVGAPLLSFAGTLLSDTIQPGGSSSTPSEEQIASLKELQTLNKNVQEVIQEIHDFKNELLSYLQETELSNLFEQISSYWTECVAILEAEDNEEYESEAQFKKTFEDFRERMSENIFLIIEKIRFDKARLYIEKIREELLTSGADIITYSVKLTLALKDYAIHSSQVMGLLKVTVSNDPQFNSSITTLDDDLKEFEGYHEQYVLGSWFNWTGNVLSQEESEGVYSGKILQLFGSKSHIAWQVGELEAFFGIGVGWVTPFRADIAPGSDIGDFSVFIGFQIDGSWERICASGEPLSVTLDCADEQSSKWKPTPCPSSLTEDEAHLDYLCIKHTASGLFLTYVPPAAETHGFLTVMGFDENNSNQLFNFTDVRRCCQISSSSDLSGSKEICLEANQTSQEALVLPKDMESFTFASCEAEVRLVAFEGRNFSKRAYTVAEGTEMSLGDPNQATSLLSYYVESVCGRIFTEENLTGEYTSICGNMTDLGEELIEKKVSVLIATNPLTLFDGPGYTGNSIIIRRSMMNLEDWPFEVRSVQIL